MSALRFAFLRFGDQTLFTDANLFRETGGFDDRRLVLEDQEIIQRLVKIGRFRVIDARVRTSARRYLQHGVWTTQIKYVLVYLHFMAGASASSNYRLYQSFFRK